MLVSHGPCQIQQHGVELTQPQAQRSMIATLATKSGRGRNGPVADAQMVMAMCTGFDYHYRAVS
jgi:hypothetical protein